MRVTFFLHWCHHWLFLFLLMLTILYGVRLYLIDILICISPMICDAKHSFMYLFTSFIPRRNFKKELIHIYQKWNTFLYILSQLSLIFIHLRIPHPSMIMAYSWSVLRDHSKWCSEILWGAGGLTCIICCKAHAFSVYYLIKPHFPQGLINNIKLLCLKTGESLPWVCRMTFLQVLTLRK